MDPIQEVREAHDMLDRLGSRHPRGTASIRERLYYYLKDFYLTPRQHLPPNQLLDACWPKSRETTVMNQDEDDGS